MVRILVDKIYQDNKHYIEGAGLSTDSKPADNVITGSLFLEVDTGDVYAFDEDAVSPASPWGKIAALGGGS